MASLICSAQNCVYNQAMYCTRDQIQVDGAAVGGCEDTCCSSFEERRHDSMRNAQETPKHNVNIDCKAKECRYNDCCHCEAGQVDISGASACRCEQTECITFSAK